MKQTEGDRNFVAPPLKTAPVFGGIAGIMTAEQGDADDGSNVPSMSYKARESGKLQDMYRRTLAASWAAQAGELPADQCIEDIFAGGDGWANDQAGATMSSQMATGGSTEDDESDGDRRTIRGHKRHASGSGSRATLRPLPQRLNSSRTGSSSDAVSGRASIAQHVQSGHDTKRKANRPMHEIDEFTAREDLRSWAISSNG